MKNRMPPYQEGDIVCRAMSGPDKWMPLADAGAVFLALQSARRSLDAIGQSLAEAEALMSGFSLAPACRAGEALAKAQSDLDACHESRRGLQSVIRSIQRAIFGGKTRKEDQEAKE